VRFRDKIAIVNAGTAGIGKEVAHRFVEEGGSAVINGRNAERASTAAREIDLTGKRVAVVEGDIDTPTTADAVVAVALDRFGRLDVLFNNVGILVPKSFLSLPEIERDSALNSILRSKFSAVQAAATAMKVSGNGGVIVQIGSMWALEAVQATPSPAYSAADAALHARITNLAIELAPQSIRLNAVIERLGHGKILTPEHATALLMALNGMRPLGRFGKPADAAEILLYLASDQTKDVTGMILPVDGTFRG
jgi:NAD(P)-dependent dehydrogenase (short-subunit alcohol dehydrogenase family)